MKTDNIEYISLRIILVPSIELTHQAIGLAKKNASYGDTFYVLDGKRYLAHLTVYFGEFPIINKERIFSTVKNIASKHKKIKLKYSKLKGANGWIGIHFIKSKELYNLHKEIVRSLNTFREEHIRDKYKRDWDSLTRSQKIRIKKYGYPEVMSHYDPHLSLLRYKVTSLSATVPVKEENKDLELPDSFSSELAITPRGDNGTVPEILKRFKLKNEKDQ